MGFNLVNVAITVRTLDATRLIRYLPQLGKEFASACRSVSCRWPERTCERCAAYDTCGWTLVFGQKLTSDPAALKRHQKPPLPFAFSFPLSEMLPEDQTEIECGLVVIGQAIPFLEMLLNGFAELLSDGLAEVAAEIIQIACRDYQGSVQNPVVEYGSITSGNLVPENLVIASTEGLVESRLWDCAELQIRLLSPLRLLEAGHIARRFDFCLFVRSVMRRVSSLAYYYGESDFDCDFKELSRQVESVICTEDHFGYTNGKNRKLTGITGYGSFLGDFSRCIPFLAIGSYVHTGKGSSFGMGSYELHSEDRF